MTPRDSPALSRRSALRLGAAAGLGLTLPTTVSAAESRQTDGADPTDLTVATWNLGLGANLFSLFLVDSEEELARTVGDLYADIERSAVTARMRAVADELARTRPDVVGVQEAALVRTATDGDGGADGPDAETVAFDFLADLTDAVGETDASYDLVQTTTNADGEFPGLVDGERIDVRLTDRDAVLVRSDADVQVTDASATTFDEALTLPLDDERTFRVDRGYGVVAATVGETDLAVVNTHLESASSSVRAAQADALASALDELDGRPILLGDLNDSPATEDGAYETLTADLADAWATARPGDDGDTCCRATTLDGPGSLDRRIDHVLASPDLPATDARLLGDDPERRVTTTVDGDERTLWPSDHAGVVAALRIGGESTATGTARATANGTAEATSAGSANATGTERPSAPGEATVDSTTDGPTTDGSTTDGPSTGENGTSATATGAGSPESDDGAGPGETSTATEAPGFGPLVGVLGALGGAAELLRRRG